MNTTSFRPVREVGRTAIPQGIRRGASLSRPPQWAQQACAPTFISRLLGALPAPFANSSEIRNAAWTLRSAARLITALPARVLLGLIWLYRRTLSPVLPVVFGPACGCRFHPTCAVYAAQAIRERGAARGTWLALCRLLKCHPLHPGGFDPVPPSPRRGPTCRAVVNSAAARDDNTAASAGPTIPSAPVSDWRIRRSQTGATLGRGMSRGKRYAG